MNEVGSRKALLAVRDVTADPFQTEAFDVLDRGNSVLVAAPTSAGKTLVAEYAIATALERGVRAAYTTPTKALSNQKLRDLRGWLGIERVGLLTGDNVVRPDADVVVMTTEVLRNMIYASSPVVEDLGVAVLDEVHYLQDPYRGAVWEEVIINVPSHVRLVCLSATVSNAVELAGWIDATAGRCTAVISRERPVPLENRYLLYERNSRKLVDLATLQGSRPNREVERLLERARGPKSTRRRQRGSNARPARARRSEIVEHLAAGNKLPAIVFVFSRQGCDDATRALAAEGVAFLDPSQQHRVREIAAAHTSELEPSDLRALGYEDWLSNLCAGVASHHAGLVPAFKEAVEDCFAAGLLAVVFATETLAVGVNMPARSVVIDQLSRFRGDGFAMLTPGEYTQLTGRAGRRGIDEVGFAYTLWHPHTGFDEAARLAASGDFELESSFRPTYNMAANLIAGHTRNEAVALLRRSFAQWRADRRIGEWNRALESERSELRNARARLRSLGGGKHRSSGSGRDSSGSRHGQHRQGQRRQGQQGRGSHRHAQRGHPDRHRDRAIVEAERRVERCAARVGRLTERIKLAEGGLARQLDATCEVLDEFGCADGWSLTATGQRLRSVFWETDLLVVLCIRDGVFDDLAPAQLAAVVSVLTYEHRSSVASPRAQYPDGVCRAKTQQIFAIASKIAHAERRCGLTPSRMPDAALVATAHAWACGATIEDLWSTEGGLPELPTGGDFVRQMRQLIDLVDRIGDVSPRAHTRRTARVARASLDRGVVAAATRVSEASMPSPAAAISADTFIPQIAKTRIRRL